MSELKQELKWVSRKINEFILNDPYPEFVHPEELRTAVRAYPLQGGKRLRPALLLWACGAFGGNPETALPAAAAVEIYHNWTLVHDDIIDCDAFRRGIPTTHSELARYAEATFDADPETAAKFGSDLAILAGDIQQGWSIHSMLSLTECGVDPALVVSLVRRLQQSLCRPLISGEAIDVELALTNPNDVTPDQVRAMMFGKTGAIFEFALQCGAAIALREAFFEDPRQQMLSQAAEHLSYAFQLQDDLLGVFGDEASFGKPLCSDFQESKQTILVLEARERMTPEQAVLLNQYFALPYYNPEAVASIRSILEDSGAADAVRQQVHVHSARAREALLSLPDNRYRVLLCELCDELLRRTV